MSTGTRPASVKNTLSRRIFTLIAVKLCKRWRPHCSTVLFLTEGICVKYGYYQDVSKAITIQSIGKHTSIPVPKVYCAFKHKDLTYIVMERIQGEYLGHKWKLRSEDSKAKILQQLRHMVDEMRSIPHPQGIGIANVNGGSLYDGRRPENLPRLRFGPFKNTTDFHHYLRRGIDLNPGGDVDAKKEV